MADGLFPQKKYWESITKMRVIYTLQENHDFAPANFLERITNTYI